MRKKLISAPVVAARSLWYHNSRKTWKAPCYLIHGRGVKVPILLSSFSMVRSGSEQNLDLAQAFRTGRLSRNDIPLQRQLGKQRKLFPAKWSGWRWNSSWFYFKRHNLWLDKDKIYAAGHSLGGFVCGQIAARRPEIKGAVLLMPCNVGRIGKIAQSDPEKRKKSWKMY